MTSWELDDELSICAGDRRLFSRDQANEAEAVLAVAAPRLLSAMKEVVDWVEANVAYGLPEELLTQACEAIRAASNDR